MATFNQNGIQFSATKGQLLPNKYGNGDNGDFADAGTDGVEPFINGVEIDWNNAALDAAKPSEPTEGFPNGTVNTTGELLKNIANLQAQVDLLTTLVKGLYSALT